MLFYDVLDKAKDEGKEVILTLKSEKEQVYCEPLSFLEDCGDNEEYGYLFGVLPQTKKGFDFITGDIFEIPFSHIEQIDIV